MYLDLGHIELLPFAALSLGMTNFAVVMLVRRMTAIFNIRYIMCIAIIIFIIGGIVCGAAPNMNTIIVGRILTGLGACGVYQL